MLPSDDHRKTGCNLILSVASTNGAGCALPDDLPPWGVDYVLKPSTDWFKVPPAVPFPPVVTSVLVFLLRMKPPLGRDSFMNIGYF